MEKNPNGDVGLDAKVQAIVEKIRHHDGGVCSVLYEDARRNPEIREAIDAVKKEILLDGVKLRTPGIGTFTLTQNVAQRAYDKLGRGDTLGAIADYAAVVAIGTTSVIPFGGDATIELLRANGVVLEEAPIHKTYNTVVGLDHLCNNLDVIAQAGLPFVPDGKDSAQPDLVPLSEGQEKALLALANRVYSRTQSKAEPTPEPTSPPHYLATAYNPQNITPRL